MKFLYLLNRLLRWPSLCLMEALSFHKNDLAFNYVSGSSYPDVIQVYHRTTNRHLFTYTWVKGHEAFEGSPLGRLHAVYERSVGLPSHGAATTTVEVNIKDLRKWNAALERACIICDRVPNRWHEVSQPGTTEHDLGVLVNSQPDGDHGYRLISDAHISTLNVLSKISGR